MEKKGPRQLTSYLRRGEFLVLDIVGVLIVIAGYFSRIEGLKEILMPIGATVFTLGITLPIALYYQLKHSSESFKIISSCEKAGISNIFISRKDDSIDLINAIEQATSKTSTELFFLGISFRTFFDPSNPRTPSVKAKLYNPSIKLRISLLDPNSDAAKRRETIEVGSTTLTDINQSLNIGVVTIVQMRIKNIVLGNRDLTKEVRSFSDMNQEKQAIIIEKLMHSLNVGIELYDFDPIIFIMGFDSSMFVEQYHFGKPKGLVEPNSCIGKRVPVLEYNKGSNGYAFYKAHFEYVWKHSNPMTEDIVKKASELMSTSDYVDFDVDDQ